MFQARLLFIIVALITAAPATEPLYLQFRPLSSLPWEERGATWKTVIPRLYREPNLMVRSTLLEEYLKLVPAADFPTVFDLCLKLEEEDSPDNLLKLLMRAWARKDAEGAWAKCNALYQVIVTAAPLDVDSWGTGIVVLNPDAVAASDFWPETDGFGDAFSEGVAESPLPQREKDRYIALQKAKSKSWSAASDAAAEKNPQRGKVGHTPYQMPPPTPEQIAEEAKRKAQELEQTRKETAQRKFLMEILACPPAEISARLSSAPTEVWNEAILARAMIRWMGGDARRAPEIVEFVLKAHDPHHVLRKVSEREPVPIEFLVEWAILDLAGFAQWKLPGEKGRPGLLEKSRAVAQAFTHRDGAEGVLNGVSDSEDEEQEVEEKNSAAFHWAQLDPGNALPWIWSHGGVRAYGMAADRAVYRDHGRGSNVFRAVFAAFDSYVVPIPDDILYMLMEQWSDTDAAACARHGVRWNLRTRRFSKERMIRLWTGYLDPHDGSVDDRHFGSLRIWAMRKPDQMRKWIRSEPLDDDVRNALLWLVDHAKGGVELREDHPPLKTP